jgi:hypothetical protein
MPDVKFMREAGSSKKAWEVTIFSRVWPEIPFKLKRAPKSTKLSNLHFQIFTDRISFLTGY